jgi:hypothetical protein
MLALGLSAQPTSWRFRYGGSLTWAAKPSVRESPNPAFNVFSKPKSPLLWPRPAPCDTHLPRRKFLRDSVSLDAPVSSAVAKVRINLSEGNAQMLCVAGLAAGEFRWNVGHAFYVSLGV